MEYKYLIPAFLKAMNEIGELGEAKYKEHSFFARASRGDFSRGVLDRASSRAICEHAQEHFSQYLSKIPHDVFKDDIHQLAAVAFNAMMEAYFAGLTRGEEPLHGNRA